MGMIVFLFNSSQRHNLSTHSWVKTGVIHSVGAHHSHMLWSPLVSGDGFPQEEVSVFFPAQHSVHFEGVGRGVRKGHHVLAKFLECASCHQLHPHWSDAAFDTERLVDGRVLLETDVQLEKEGEEVTHR